MEYTASADSQIYSLRVGDVHVWMAQPNRCCQPELMSTYLAWLDEQERSRYDRFRFPQHRHEYLVAHALLRSSLSRYGACEPGEWMFSTNPYGRPEIQEGSGQPPLRFNLSHTDGLVVCAITQSAAVGVDVECMARTGDLSAIAELSFAPEELAELNLLAGRAWSQRFFNLWTLKEAYVKAQGKGLSMPLRQVRFSLNAVGTIQFNPLLEPESAQAWKFALLNSTQQHCLSVAAYLDDPLRIQVGWATPGLEYRTVPFPYINSQGVVQRDD